MGLYIVHMVEYFELYWYKPEPGWIHDLIFFLFGGKAYGIFALLFGFSFNTILTNQARRGIDFRTRFLWRMCLLFIFGYVHSLLYAGDILQLLALGGLLLVACNKLTNAWITTIALVFLIQTPTAALLTWQAYWPTADYQQPLFYNLMAANFEIFAHANLSELLTYNRFEGQQGKWAFFIETGRLWNIFGLMFVGVLLSRNGFFTRHHQPRRLTLFIVAALLLYLLLNAIQAGVTGSLRTPMANWFAGQMLIYYGNLTLIGAWIGLFILTYQTRPGQRLLVRFAPTGKITLTLYLTQSLVFVPLYYGFGLSWYASMGQTASLLIGIACWLLQMIFATYYLKHFSYGPMEKLWRVATHYKRSSPSAPA